MKFNLDYVLDCALDGIFIVAQDRRLVLFNRACEELYGLSRGEMVNQACWKLSAFKQSWKTIARKGRKISYGELGAQRQRMVLPHKNGKQVWVETTYTPIIDQANQEIAYVMGVIKDISELKRVEAEKDRLQNQLENIRKELEDKYDFSSIVGRSPKILEALKLAAQVARQNTTVMLVGESGTGKELLAKAIHYNSARASKPFVALNCSAFPDTLIESELFGYEKGAFTGAEKFKPGKIQLAAGGTLFLDEVTEMSPPTQAKILRLIQEREFEPLGAVKTQRADIRIIAATNKDLQPLVHQGTFREDLYYRLFVFPIVLPPLRESKEDVPLLVDSMLKKFNHDMAKSIQGIAPEALDILVNYEWRGNVRELQNVMERMMILSKTDTIEVSDLPRYLRRSSDTRQATGEPPVDLYLGFSLDDSVHQFENQLILQALKKSRNNKTQAAHLLGLTRSTFRYKLAKLPRDALHN